jgi:hypothetical protein
MFMRYLKESDYLSKINRYDLETLLHDEQNPSAILFDTEIRAQESISLFLRKRYNLEQLFATYPFFVSGSNVFSGSTYWYTTTDNYEAYLYTAKDTTHALPTTSGWTMIEPRHPLIVDWMVAVCIYKLHERVNPDNIPTQRKDAYAEVTTILKAIQSEKLSPNFPEIEGRNFTIYVNGNPDSGISYLY